MTDTMTAPLTFHAAGATDLGTVRTNNEDAALGTPRLVALADGMGGHAAGEVASAVVVDRLAALAAGDDDLTADALTGALTAARGKLRALSAAQPAMSGMGTTVVALAIGPEGVLLVHVGDSRLYRLRGGELSQLTTDHTHVQRLVDSGRLDPADVREHPFRSVILRSLDDSSDDLPDIAPTADVAPGDRLLLCSDGLSDYVDEDAIADAIGGTPQEAADRLVALALAHETRDNVTVLVADLLAAEGAAGGPGAAAVLLGATLADAGLESVPEGVTSVPEGVTSVPEGVTSVPDDEAPSQVLPSGSSGVRDRSGLWLGLVVLTFVLTTAIVWVTQG